MLSSSDDDDMVPLRGRGTSTISDLKSNIIFCGQRFRPMRWSCECGVCCCCHGVKQESSMELQVERDVRCRATAGGDATMEPLDVLYYIIPNGF
jgi:hypothetical protein